MSEYDTSHEFVAETPQRPHCITTGLEKGGSLPHVSSIAADGFPADWSEVEVASHGEEGETLKLAVDCDNLFVRVEGPKLSDRTQLLIDSDGDAATGEQFDLRDAWAASGADYLFSNDWLARHTKKGWIWSDTIDGTPVVRGDRARIGSTVKEYKFAIRSHEGRIPPRFGLVFRNMEMVPDEEGTLQEVVINQVPASGMWRIPPQYEQRGMIVPAYLDVKDDEGWTKLGEAARILTSRGKEGVAGDFWVAVSGADSGPHEIGTALLERWSALYRSGASLFAYVRTCEHTQTPSAENPGAAHVCDGLRPVRDVVNDLKAYQRIVADWNASSPEAQITLAGAWVDEFYPQFDVDAERPAQLHAREFEESGQIDPRGGSYAALLEALRGVLPGKLIANAGGRISSNRLAYGKLADVVCSFEDELAHVDPWVKDEESGPGLQIQLLRPRYGQLALVHTNATRMEEVVKRMFDEGYSHIYTTDVSHWTEDGKLNALWNSVPSYLVEEATYVRELLSAFGRR